MLRIRGERFAHASIAANVDVEVSEEVLAVGFPLDLPGGLSVSKGIVSAKRQGDSPGVTHIQTDAAMNPGQSGGPLINRKGEIVGLTVFGLTTQPANPTQGMNFAISVQSMAPMIPLLQGGRIFGLTVSYKIAYLQPGSRIWLSAVDGSSQRILNNKLGLVVSDWSPDGRYLLLGNLCAEGKADCDIRAVDTRTGTEVSMVSLRAIDFTDRYSLSSPQWCSDGVRIAVALGSKPFAGGGVFVANTTDGSVVELTLDYPGTTVGLDWSPDCRQLVWPTEDMELEFIDVEDGQRHKVPVDWRVTDLEWSPDGKWIAVISSPPATEDTHNLYLTDPNGSTTRLLAQNVQHRGGLSWSPDSQNLAFVRKTGDQVSIWTVSLEGTNMRRIADGYYAVWSPVPVP